MTSTSAGVLPLKYIISSSEVLPSVNLPSFSNGTFSIPGIPTRPIPRHLGHDSFFTISGTVNILPAGGLGVSRRTITPLPLHSGQYLGLTLTLPIPNIYYLFKLEVDLCRSQAKRIGQI